MNTEVYIENYHLDVSKDISALITYELDNIKNFADRSTTWSKTIVLPGTANNNKLFGHIFQIGQSNFYESTLPNVGYNFNASKSADCIIFQDQLQTFRGVLRLLQINVVKGRPEYEVAVFGKLASLNVALGGAFLEDLDFSAYDHVYNTTNIIASWDNTPGTGYYYPLIDYGTYSDIPKHSWDIRTFRPALYAREYIDKMFTAAGYRFSSALLDTDRFKKLIIPNNRKLLTISTSRLLDAARTTNQTALFNAPDTTRLIFQTSFGALFAFDNPAPNTTRFTYIGADSVNTTLEIRLSFEWQTSGNTISIDLRKNSITIATKLLPNTGGFVVTSGVWNEDVPVSLTTGDYLEFWVTVSNSSLTPYRFILKASTIAVTSLSNIPVPISVGDTVTINDTLPKNIRQIDFLVGIVKLFNLYVYEDKFDPTLIYITPYVDFYSTDSSDAIDWTYKLNRDKAIMIKPMSELNARKYDFKYKSDSDYYNDLYRKRYNQGYGDYVYDSLYEFAENSSSLEILFSATPLVGYSGEEKVYSTIFKRNGPDGAAVEEVTDSNIRILQSKKVSGVASWDIKDGATVLASTNDYGYAGHFNDPDAPSNDLNFGALRELFFLVLSGDLSVTQFNVYWSGYMAEITDKDSKLVTCNVYLNPKDIFSLDFSKKIFIDGVLFRLNSIRDYNASKPTDCVVELLKINYLTYSGEVPAEGSNFLLWEDSMFLLDSDGGKIKYL